MKILFKDNIYHDIGLKTEVPSLIKIYETNADGQVLYVGYALPGTKSSEAGWIIFKMTYATPGENTMFIANGILIGDQIWDNRGSLSYS